MAGSRRALVALLVLAALAVAALVGMRWGDGEPTAGTVLAPAPAAATTGGDGNDYAVPTGAAGWADLLSTLYTRRAEAFEGSAPDALTGVYTRSSPQAQADRREIHRLTAAGLRVDGFAPEVVGVVSADWRAPTVTLLVRDRFGPYAVVDAEQVVTSYAGRDEARVQVQLRLTDAGWRIDTAVRLAASG